MDEQFVSTVCMLSHGLTIRRLQVGKLACSCTKMEGRQHCACVCVCAVCVCARVRACVCV